jgi:hypothetical protein
MNTDRLLGGLEKVRRIGQGRWTARCPAHEDRAPSLSVRETDDGRVLMYCFAGCQTEAVIDALGLRWEDLMEPLPAGVHMRPKVRRPWNVGDALALIDQEATVLAIIVADMAKRGVLPAHIKDRALKATGRLSGVADALRR